MWLKTAEQLAVFGDSEMAELSHFNNLLLNAFAKLKIFYLLLTSMQRKVLMLNLHDRLRIIYVYIKTQISPPSIPTDSSSSLNSSDSVVFEEKQNSALFSMQDKEILGILEGLQETYETNQCTAPNETGKGEESINLENIISVLLRDEAENSSKIPLSSPSICMNSSSSLNSSDSVGFEEKHNPALLSMQDK